MAELQAAPELFADTIVSAYEPAPSLTIPVHGTVTIPGTRVPVPYTGEIPHDLSCEEYVLLGNGLGAIKRHQRDTRHALASEHGVAAFTYDPARLRGKQGSKTERLFDPQKLHAETMTAIIEDIVRNKSITKLVNGRRIQAARPLLVPHSMNELASVRVALEDPEAIAGVVHMETVGSEGRLGLKLVPRTAMVIGLEVIPAITTGKFGYDPRLALREAAYFYKDPLRSAGEIISCMLADTRDGIQSLHEYGVYQAHIGGTDDHYFRPRDTVAAVGTWLDFWTEIDMNHIGPQIKASLAAGAIGQIAVQRPTIASPLTARSGHAAQLPARIVS